MKNKIIISAIFMGILSILLTGCSLNKNNNSNLNNPEKFDTLAQALDYYYNLYNNETNNTSKKKLMNKLKKYVLKDINGKYYNFGTTLFDKKSYNRFIYIKNKDEVYIIPFFEEDISIDKLDTIDNLEQYKYKIIDVETKQNDGKYHKYKSAKVKFQSYLWADKINDNTNEYYKYIELEYYSDNSDYTMTGYFAEEITDNDDLTSSKCNNIQGYSCYTKYYRSKGEVKSKEEKEQEERNKKEQIKDSIPQVGMSASEVEQTKWGFPDKINKDTYSWGTTEQWVYEDYGYVYFKNGKVTSVSER